MYVWMVSEVMPPLVFAVLKVCPFGGGPTTRVDEIRATAARGGHRCAAAAGGCKFFQEEILQFRIHIPAKLVLAHPAFLKL